MQSEAHAIPLPARVGDESPIRPGEIRRRIRWGPGTLPGAVAEPERAVTEPIPADVAAYLDAIAPEHRPMWDRVDGLVRSLHPDVELILTYDMPTFVVGERRLPVGVWKHGLSLYGLHEDNDAGFLARHPDLSSGRGTVRLPSARAAEWTDDELQATLAAALGS